MYIKLTNGQPENYSIGQLRRDNPNTSFPKNPSDSLLAKWGVFPVIKADVPSYNGLTQTIKEVLPTQIDGVWTQQWVVENLPQEQAKSNVRADRDKQLAETDWTQVADSPVDKEAWATYRQALRDVPAQAGFPWDVTWPESP
jgi:hypothetical protein